MMARFVARHGRAIEKIDGKLFLSSSLEARFK